MIELRLRLAVMFVEAALPSSSGTFLGLSMLAIVIGGRSHGGSELDLVVYSLYLFRLFL
jgi:hypothetical protein